MLEIIEAQSAGEMRQFFSLSERSGYLKEECRYLETYAARAMNPVLSNGPSRFLLAKRDGRPVFRALVFSDEVYKARTGKKEGCFSLFDGENDEYAAQMILERALDVQRAFGNDALIGPVSPDGRGFFHGVSNLDAGALRGILTGPGSPWKIRLIECMGFSVIGEEYAYKVEIPEENKFKEAAERAKNRFHVEIECMRAGILREKWKRCICEFSGGRAEDTYRMLDRIRPFISKDYSFLAFTGTECKGFLISLIGSNGVLRATTVFTDRSMFSPPVTLSLLSTFIDRCIKDGRRYVEASVIDAQNFASNRVVSSLEGSLNRSYIRFSKKVSKD